ncbi:MAG: hypothetical protein BRD55_04745 [Bacteroidetes bacterium SW_9_63_38]|nr:MAG: hypothetical protein BRD55_04745 [Bacteroidetes bacterium SW_9_63_38]
MDKDVNDYRRLADKEGIGELNERERAIEGTVEWLEKHITQLLEDVEGRIEDVYPEKSDDKKSELMAWIQASVAMDSPRLYLVGTLQQDLDDEVAAVLVRCKYPRLFVEDEERRDYWGLYGTEFIPCAEKKEDWRNDWAMYRRLVPNIFCWAKRSPNKPSPIYSTGALPSAAMPNAS